MVQRQTIFWDVDTQYDFMRPDGALYVAGAVQIIEKVSNIRKFALDNGYCIIASADSHSGSDGEISDSPDYRNSFPPHCLESQPGSERVGYLGELPIESVPKIPVSDEEVKQMAGREQFHIVIKKDEFDVFSNPNTLRLLEAIRPGKVIVFGVSLDVCVRYSVEGLLSWGGAGIIVLADAVRSLDVKRGRDILNDFVKKGVEVLEFDEVVEFL